MRYGVEKISQAHARLDDHNNADDTDFEPGAEFMRGKPCVYFLDIARAFYFGNHNCLCAMRRKGGQVLV